MAAGDPEIRFGVDITAVKTGLVELRNQVKGASHEIQKDLSSAFSVKALLVAGLEEGIRGIIEYGDKVYELGQRFGVSTTTIQQFGNAAEKNGSSMEGVAQSFGKLEIAISKALAGNSKLIGTFDRAGISFKELQTLSPDQIYLRLGAAGLGAADAVALLGLNGLAVLPTLKALADGTTEFGSAIDKINIQRLHEADDVFKQLFQDLKIGGGIVVGFLYGAFDSFSFHAIAGFAALKYAALDTFEGIKKAATLDFSGAAKAFGAATDEILGRAGSARAQVLSALQEKQKPKATPPPPTAPGEGETTLDELLSGGGSRDPAILLEQIDQIKQAIASIESPAPIKITAEADTKPVADLKGQLTAVAEPVTAKVATETDTKPVADLKGALTDVAKPVAAKVTTDADTSKVDALQGTLGEVKKPVTAHVLTEAETDKVADYQARIDAIQGKTVTVLTEVETAKVADYQVRIDAIQGKTVHVLTEAETAKVADYQARIDSIKGKTVTVLTEAETAKVADYQARIDAIQGKTVTVLTEAETAKVADYQARIDAIQGKTVHVLTEAETAKVADYQSRIDAIKGKTVTVLTEAETAKVADYQAEIDAIQGKTVHVLTEAETAKVADYQARIDAIQGKTVTVLTEAETAKVADYQARIDALKGRSVSIQTEAETAQIAEYQAQIAALKDRKIAVHTEADVATIESYQSAIDALKDKDVSLRTEADTAKIADFQARIDELKGRTVEIQTVADTARIDELQTSIDAIKGRGVEIRTEADTAIIASYQSAVDALKGKDISLRTEADTATIASYQARIDEIEGRTVAIQTEADTARIDNLQVRIDAIAKPATARILTEADTAKIAEYQAQLDAIKGRNVTIQTEADTVKIAEYQAQIDAIKGPVVVTIGADTDTATAIVNAFKDDVDSVSEQVTIPVRADTAAADASVDALKKDVAPLRDPVVVPVTAETAPASQAVGALKQNVAGLQEPVIAKVGADTGTASAIMAAFKDDVDQVLGPTVAKVDVQIDPAKLAQLDALKRKLAELQAATPHGVAEGKIAALEEQTAAARRTSEQSLSRLLEQRVALQNESVALTQQELAGSIDQEARDKSNLALAQSAKDIESARVKVEKEVTDAADKTAAAKEKSLAASDKELASAEKNLGASREATREIQLELQGRADLAHQAQTAYEFDQKIAAASKAAEDATAAAKTAKTAEEKKALLAVAATNAALAAQLGVEKGVTLEAEKKAAAEKAAKDAAAEAEKAAAAHAAAMAVESQTQIQALQQGSAAQRDLANAMAITLDYQQKIDAALKDGNVELANSLKQQAQFNLALARGLNTANQFNSERSGISSEDQRALTAEGKSPQEIAALGGLGTGISELGSSVVNQDLDLYRAINGVTGQVDAVALRINRLQSQIQAGQSTNLDTQQHPYSNVTFFEAYQLKQKVTALAEQEQAAALKAQQEQADRVLSLQRAALDALIHGGDLSQILDTPEYFAAHPSTGVQRTQLFLGGQQPTEQQTADFAILDEHDKIQLDFQTKINDALAAAATARTSGNSAAEETNTILAAQLEQQQATTLATYDAAHLTSAQAAAKQDVIDRQKLELDYQNQINAAVAAGNQTGADQLTAQKSIALNIFDTAHPAAATAETATTGVTQSAQDLEIQIANATKAADAATAQGNTLLADSIAKTVTALQKQLAVAQELEGVAKKTTDSAERVKELQASAIGDDALASRLRTQYDFTQQIADATKAAAIARGEGNTAIATANDALAAQLGIEERAVLLQQAKNNLFKANLDLTVLSAQSKINYLDAFNPSIPAPAPTPAPAPAPAPGIAIPGLPIAIAPPAIAIPAAGAASVAVPSSPAVDPGAALLSLAQTYFPQVISELQQILVKVAEPIG